jgi:hypothetical protein
MNRDQISFTASTIGVVIVCALVVWQITTLFTALFSLAGAVVVVLVVLAAGGHK